MVRLGAIMGLGPTQLACCSKPRQAGVGGTPAVLPASLYSHNKQTSQGPPLLGPRQQV